MPLGARLALFDHRDITGSLYWSLPAVVCLLLSAIAQPIRGVRVALVVTGCICLLLSMRGVGARFARSYRTLRRMKFGRLALGRIIACRYEPESRRAMRPLAKILKEWDARDARAQFNEAVGCLFKPMAVFIAVVGTLFFTMVLGAAISRALSLPGVTFVVVDRPFDFKFFLQSVAGFIVIVVMFIVAREIMRVYYLVKTEEWMNEYRDESAQVTTEEVLRAEIKAMLQGPPANPQEQPLPPDVGDYNKKLLCKVEYPGAGRVVVSDAIALFSTRLQRTGVEWLLFDPAAPAEVDLLQALPARIVLDAGDWQRPPVAGAMCSIGFAAAVFVTALGALFWEAAALALG